MVTKYQERKARTMTPPARTRATPPALEMETGADRPNLIASAISSLGSSNPSWAQRKGRTRVSGKFLVFMVVVHYSRVHHIKPHDVNVGVSLDDHIELKSRPDGERESKVRLDVNIELMFVLLRTEARHRV